MKLLRSAKGSRVSHTFGLNETRELPGRGMLAFSQAPVSMSRSWMTTIFAYQARSIFKLKALEANPEAGFVCGAMVMADQNYQATGEVFLPSQTSGDVFWELMELDFPVMPLSTLIRKDCLLRVGLLNQRLGGIDDWDIFVRIAELYPVLVIDEPMGLYRQPTPSSAQGSSSQGTQLLRAARHQLQLLKLPRAQAATQGQRRTIRKRTLNRIADTLLWSAARRLPEKEFGFVCRNTLTALRLNPLRAVRPRAYQKLASHLLAFRRTQRV